MGDVKKVLASCKLRQREKHNSRLFVDLCENIHIHYREYRFVFSLPEFFEFCEIITNSEQDIRNYLVNNPDYEEGKYHTTVIIAGGRERQLKFLNKSPAPNQSYYENNSFAIELQEEYVTDEIHIHYRDLRLVLNRNNFKDIALQFIQASQELEQYEKSFHYVRQTHPDREIDSFNRDYMNESSKNHIQGATQIKLDKIKSYWFEDITKEWIPDKEYSNFLKTHLRRGKSILPILLSKEQDGSHYIIDGHHRYYAALTSGAQSINAIVADITFEESEQIRKAEVLLKQFDKKTGNKYRLSDFLKHYIAFSLNDYYKNAFRNITKSNARNIISRIYSLVLLPFIKGFCSKPLPSKSNEK